MGHKVHPYGFRIGVIKPLAGEVVRGSRLRHPAAGGHADPAAVAKQLSNASVSQVEIERGINHVTVTVHTAKPGIVIGKGGANVDALRNNIGKQTGKKVKLEIKEILQPELDGMLVAQNVAGQLERRIAFRKAIKQSIQRTIKAGAKGVKIQVAGPPRRLGDEPHRVGPRRPHPVGHAPRGHQLRRGPRAHHLRPHRGEGVGLPRRAARRRSRQRAHRATRAAPAADPRGTRTRSPRTTERATAAAATAAPTDAAAASRSAPAEEA